MSKTTQLMIESMALLAGMLGGIWFEWYLYTEGFIIGLFWMGFICGLILNQVRSMIQLWRLLRFKI